MSTVAELAHWLEQFAPLSLAESWDNVGLLWGDPAAELEPGDDVPDGHASDGTRGDRRRGWADCEPSPGVVSSGQARSGRRPRHGDALGSGPGWVAIASPHTAFDNTQGESTTGLLAVSAWSMLSRSARHRRRRPARSLSSPSRECAAILTAAFAAGAGTIGAYEQCSFTSAGQGTFFGTEETNPAIGQRGQRETVRERRIELVCPARQLAAVLAEIRSAHP